MFHFRGVRHVDFDGAKLSLFPDLSRRTLMQRWALKPVLEALQDAKLIYRWGFPFQLSVTKDGQQVVLRSREELPQLLQQLGVPAIDILDWRSAPEIPLPARPQPWRTSRRGRNRRRSEEDSHRDESHSPLRPPLPRRS